MEEKASQHGEESLQSRFLMGSNPYRKRTDGLRGKSKRKKKRRAMSESLNQECYGIIGKCSLVADFFLIKTSFEAAIWPA